MPIGYLIATGLIASCTLFALAPPKPRQSSPSNKSSGFGFLVNELPFVAFYWLLASTALAIAQRDIASPVGWIALGLAALATVGLVIVAWRALQAGPAVDRALSEGLGSEWRTDLDPGLAARLRRRLPLASILFGPFFFRRRDVERIANISYGDAGKLNLLDVYRHRSRPSGGPTLVYLHGGAFRSGRKSREARPLLYRLASQGWVCISANYRLSPAAQFPDHLIDVKKVIAWVREHGHEYGADPTVVVRGRQLRGRPPGLDGRPHAERPRVSAWLRACGHLGHRRHLPVRLLRPPRLPARYRPRPPWGYLRADAPPFFVAHGDQDTVVLVEDARLFVEQLRSSSSGPVVYAELPGAQHTFDLFHSIRFESVVDAIEAFAAWVRSRDRRGE